VVVVSSVSRAGIRGILPVDVQWLGNLGFAC
jgi:hypothetical protein